MIRQILCDFRCQPIVTWVTVVGTALSIFLLAAIYMVHQVDVVAVSPESRRDRIMYSLYSYFRLEERYYNSSSMSRGFAERIYGGLPGVERMSLVGSHVPQKDVNLSGGAVERMAVKNVDGEYWRIYDYEFLEGRPFTKAEVERDERKVIVTDEAARRLDAEGSLVGREILIRHIPFEVIGVVKSTSPLLNYSYADMFVPYHEKSGDLVGGYQGSTGVVLLLKEGVDKDSVKAEVKRRYMAFNSEITKEPLGGMLYLGTPYDSEDMSLYNSGLFPEYKPRMRQWRYTVYLILLILPAINLSGITHSRLRRRVSEIGIRRAYGASRGRIFSEMVAENLLLTLFGGIIGLSLAIVFMLLFFHMFVDYGTGRMVDVPDGYTPTIGMLFSWGTFAFVFFACFVLNVMSTGIPVWCASRLTPAQAISR